MSDSFLRLIPVDPEFAPDEHAAASAEVMFRSFVSDADEVTSKLLEHTQFIDAGSNFETVSCPACHADINLDWWGNEMERACEENFSDLETVLPCCGATKSLNDLSYSWPQGFARYLLESRNPQIRELSPIQLEQLSHVIGCSIRVIWSHI